MLIKHIDFVNTLASQGVTVAGEITAERKSGGPTGYYLQVTPPTGTAGSGYVGYYEHNDINLSPGETIFYSAYIRGPVVAMCWPLGEGVYNWAYLHKMVSGMGTLLWSDGGGLNLINTTGYVVWHHAIIQFTKAIDSGQNGITALWINGALVDCVDTPNFSTLNMGRLRSVSFAGSSKFGYFDLADIRVGQTLADVQPISQWRCGGQLSAVQPTIVPAISGVRV